MRSPFWKSVAPTRAQEPLEERHAQRGGFGANARVRVRGGARYGVRCGVRCGDSYGAGPRNVDLNAVFEGDADVLLASATEGASLSRAVGDLYAQHMMELNLGGAALMAGDMPESRQHYEQGLRIAFQVDDRIGQAYMVAALGFHAAMNGRPGVAARLLGASETIRLSAGASVMAPLAPFIAHAEQAATEALGTARFQTELEAGRGLARDAAVRLALGEADTTGKRSSDGAGYELGARQLEVAQLVAKGLSNRQIASQLFLSERTVDSHVRTILNKLGFNTRAQIAGWVASRD